ncbi:hypothetical protein FHR81_000541 [Actinoalloteichus hoggarensis]|uniref:Uncharacterized protein n=1 Tax=Actinoalloteichus hoggarensis TaxID=1470176 RepID=A0A221W2F2_9PSEU|nr:hypothetical protein AHOG_10690 [Actinoalloteichus hoggarensis]MBB5919512.1 hypothetical protein [Actinoalloteichus hoggarensis]
MLGRGATACPPESNTAHATVLIVRRRPCVLVESFPTDAEMPRLRSGESGDEALECVRLHGRGDGRGQRQPILTPRAVWKRSVTSAQLTMFQNALT